MRGLIRRRTIRAIVIATAAVASLTVGPELGAAVVSIDFEQLPDGSDMPAGEELQDEFGDPPYDVHFPRKVRAVDCTDTTGPCTPAARSGQMVVQPLEVGQPDNDLFEARFDQGLHRVSVYVLPDKFQKDGIEITVTLTAYNAVNNVVDQDQRQISRNQGWQLFTAEVSASQIRRVTVGSAGAQDNRILLDDLSLETLTAATPAPTATPANQRPSVRILAPEAEAIVVGSPVVFRVDLRDDSAVVTNTVQVLRRGETEGSEATVCGEGSDPCRLGEQDIRVAIPEQEGRYTVFFRVCDEQGLCGSNGRGVRRAPPATEVEIAGVEFNQGVQNEVFEFAGTSDNLVVRSADGHLPLLSGKDSLVRYFLFARQRLSDFRATLDVTIVDRPSRARAAPGAARPGARGALRHTLQLRPIRDASRDFPVEATPTSVSARQRSMLAMRHDEAKTLNFVIPGGSLRLAGSVTMKLVPADPRLRSAPSLSKQLTVDLDVSPKLGLNLYRMGAQDDMDVRWSQIDAGVLRYLEDAYPAKVEVLSRRDYWSETTDCDEAKSELSGDYGDADTPVTYGAASRRTWVENLGIRPATRWDDCDGLAHYGNPGGEGYGVGSTSITRAAGDVAAQEIAHSIGYTHASNDHDENAGGGFEEWPYPHGGFGAHASPIYEGSFGMYALPAATSGSYIVNVVDHCQSDDIATRAGRPPKRSERPGSLPLQLTLPKCPVADDENHHDFMSYGGGPELPFTQGLGRRIRRWISDITYARIYRAIAFGELSPPSGSARGGPSSTNVRTYGRPSIRREAPAPAERDVDGIEIRGVIDKSDDVTLFPLLRHPVHPQRLEGTGTGPWKLRFFRASGERRYERDFEPQPISGHGTKGPRRMFVETVPDLDGARRVDVMNGDRVVETRTASESAPSVRITKPGPDDTITGPTTIDWQADDDDGESLYFAVYYSPDRGKTWQGIGRVRSAEMPFDPASFPDSRSGVFRVVASDGFNSASDTSDAVEVASKRPSARPWWFYAALAGIALALIAAGILLLRRRRAG